MNHKALPDRHVFGFWLTVEDLRSSLHLVEMFSQHFRYSGPDICPHDLLLNDEIYESQSKLLFEWTIQCSLYETSGGLIAKREMVRLADD